jgi:AbiV family abortive infection protein
MTSDEAKKIVRSVMPRYEGALTQEQVAEGVKLASDNAVRLLKSARLLLHAGDAPTAMSLSILALEEHGKIEILNRIGNEKNCDIIRKYWSDYHKHISKTGAFTEIYAMLKGVVEEVEIREFQEKNSDLLPMVDLLKQLGFYTDCSGKCRWHDPRKIVDLLVVPLFFAVEKIILGENTLDKILSEKLLDAINDRMLD